MSTLRVATVQDLSSANPSTPEQIAQGRAKAWVRFNTTTSTTITDDYGISSLTDNGTGDTTLNFDTNMSNANYAAFMSSQSSAANGPDSCSIFFNRTANAAAAPTVSACRMSVVQSTTGTAYDRDNLCVVIFGD